MKLKALAASPAPRSKLVPSWVGISHSWRSSERVGGTGHWGWNFWRRRAGKSWNCDCSALTSFFVAAYPSSLRLSSVAAVSFTCIASISWLAAASISSLVALGYLEMFFFGILYMNRDLKSDLQAAGAQKKWIVIVKICLSLRLSAMAR